MTREAKIRLALGVPGAMLAAAAVVFALGGTAFVPRNEYGPDMRDVRAEFRRHEYAIDSLRVNLQGVDSRLDRILCLTEAQAGLRHYTQCTR